MKLVLLWMICLFSFSGFAQFEEEEFTKEITGGINLNTSGGIIGGLSGRFAYKHSEKRFRAGYLDIVNVKHSKEERFSSSITGNSFIPQKISYLLSIRPQYGNEFLLFNKYPEEGVRLIATIAVGPSIALVKPYFIEYDYTSPGELVPDHRVEAYDPLTHDLSKILGKGNYFYGLKDLDVRLGLNFKAALNFEFGKFPRTLSGIETGFSFEAFPKHIDIYYIDENKFFYSAVYLTFYYGVRK